MSELYGIVSLGGTVIGASLNQRGLKGETGATGATGNGIASISKTGSSGLIDTYTITYTNGNTATFTVTNGQDGHSPIITASKSGKTTSVFLDGTKIAEIGDGVGIDSIYKTGSSGLDPVVDEYTILYDDGNYTTFTVTNGKKGDKGDPQSPYTSTPNMDGVGSAGSSSNYSRGDHVHPSDTTKVDKVAGKGLSENDFTDSLKTKLDGIASGAEVNVQSDWNQSTNTADDYIKNKPDLSVYAPLASPALTGTPTAPTATEGTNTTQIATTAFVKTADDAVKGMIKELLPTETASGDIASFNDGQAVIPAVSVVATITPIQSGSGTPSPSNVRPISGHDEVGVGVVGKNLFGGIEVVNALRQSYSNIVVNTANESFHYSPTSAEGYKQVVGIVKTVGKWFPFKENTQYTFIIRIDPNSTNNHLNLGVAYTDGTNNGGFYSSSADSNGWIVFTTPVGKSVRNLYGGIYTTTSAEIYYNDFGIFEGVVTKDQFETYNGQTYTTTLPSTTYGGTLDLVSGVLTVDRASVTLNGSNSWVSQDTLTTTRHYSCDISGITASTVVYSDDVMGDSMQTIASNVDSVHMNHRNVAIHVWIPKDIAPSTYFATNPLQVVYPLTTPTTYQLTPQQIDTLKGQNNITATSGQVSVTYKADIQKYIDNAIATFA